MTKANESLFRHFIWKFLMRRFSSHQLHHSVVDEPIKFQTSSIFYIYIINMIYIYICIKEHSIPRRRNVYTIAPWKVCHADVNHSEKQTKKTFTFYLIVTESLLGNFSLKIVSSFLSTLHDIHTSEYAIYRSYALVRHFSTNIINYCKY